MSSKIRKNDQIQNKVAVIPQQERTEIIKSQGISLVPEKGHKINEPSHSEGDTTIEMRDSKEIPKKEKKNYLQRHIKE